MKKINTLKNRDLYLNKILKYKDVDLIKVITGVRYSGKTSILKLVQEHLIQTGIEEKQIIHINLEEFKFINMNVEDLYEYVKARVLPDKKMYLFFDEIQKIKKFEIAINAFKAEFECDIYLTGSNSFLLSSELSTYLSGRYVEINVLPLSFKEKLAFNDFEVTYDKTSHIIIKKNNEIYNKENLFKNYILYGGMPIVDEIENINESNLEELFNSLYSSIIYRDIIQYNNRSDNKVTNDTLLNKIIYFLAENIGNNVSLSNVGNVLQNEGLLSKDIKPSTKTVQSYVKTLTNSYLFYEIKRYDIKGKEYLKTLGKYYIVDIGIRNYFLGFSEHNTGFVIENIVYLELLRRGYNVAIGKYSDYEVDFICKKMEEKMYIQVTERLDSDAVRLRETRPLLKIQDNFPKFILTMSNTIFNNIDGIIVKNIIDWLLE